jgi:hypothetical protein
MMGPFRFRSAEGSKAEKEKPEEKPSGLKKLL